MIEADFSVIRDNHPLTFFARFMGVGERLLHRAAFVLFVMLFRVEVCADAFEFDDGADVLRLFREKAERSVGFSGVGQRLLLMRKLPFGGRFDLPRIAEDSRKDVNQEIAVQRDFATVRQRGGSDGVPPLRENGAFLWKISDL